LPVKELVMHADQQRLVGRLDLVVPRRYQRAVSMALTPPIRPATKASMSVEPTRPG
jgi:hypothetical protein